MSDTPRTDRHILVTENAPLGTYGDLRGDEKVLASFARELERELLRASVDAARWRMAMHYMTAHNRSIVEGLIPDELPDAAPQGQEVCQHARLPNDSVPEPAVAAPRHGPGDTDEARKARLPAVIASYARAIRRKNEQGEWPIDSDFAIILERAAEALTIPPVARPFDPNVRLYAALNLLEQVYDEMQLQGCAMDGQWATATKKVLDEHGWS